MFYISAIYSYGGLDVRRKNATRESTSTLKAWLYEHIKNPYPTKGEKIMLAIITKMTLTQVSTWFANARRRLKKENKMTWEPRNRADDEDDDDDKMDSDSERADIHRGADDDDDMEEIDIGKHRFFFYIFLKLYLYQLQSYMKTFVHILIYIRKRDIIFQCSYLAIIFLQSSLICLFSG